MQYKGEMQYGEQKIGDNWYYFSTWDGAMYKGFRNEKEGKSISIRPMDLEMPWRQRINEKWYYFDSTTECRQDLLIWELRPSIAIAQLRKYVLWRKTDKWKMVLL